MKEDLQEKIDKAKIALRCLYVAVPESIAHDVERKVEDVFALLSAPEPASQPFIRAGEPVRGTHLRPGDGNWCEYLHNGKICNKCGFSAPEPAETGERLEGWAFHMEAGAWHFESDPEHEPTVADERATLIIRSDQ
jgi:hypothetical protein